MTITLKLTKSEATRLRELIEQELLALARLNPDEFISDIKALNTLSSYINKKINS